MLDRYDLGDELGTAARSAVFAARERSTGRTVAVKLTPSFDGDCVCGGAEKRAAPALPSHPNVVSTYASGEHRNVQYTVTELVPGTDLGAWAAGGLPLETVLYVVERVAFALHHAHRHGVVHGDVKPSNIFFDAARVAVKLGDFPRSPNDAATRATPAYLSPQRLCGMPPTPHCDQFALGVTLYQLACGHHPFARASRIEMAYAAVHEPHADIREHLAHAPQDLTNVLARALAKTAEARYRSLREIGFAVRRLRVCTSRRMAPA